MTVCVFFSSSGKPREDAAYVMHDAAGLQGRPMASHPLCRHIVHCAAWLSKSLDKSQALSLSELWLRVMGLRSFNPDAQCLLSMCNHPKVNILSLIPLNTVFVYSYVIRQQNNQWFLL